LHHRFHSGIDIKAGFDTVYAILPGKIKVSSSKPIIGNYLIIDHGNYQSVYGHLSALFFRSGALISSGHPIGISGSSGRVTGPHLHFSIKHRGRFINPLYFLRLMAMMDQTQIYNHLNN